ncbi:histidine kinase [Streptomyces sp. YIM 130001]|uniref:sensor histidine kinase n=1 Tax=Streptomyces sp. YIM 130001 TaxID=2259644 RepID=UPI001F099EF3|nr:histidine kinase [Streptomyces sp. YIM 130001]
MTRFVQHRINRLRAFDGRHPAVWDLLLTALCVLIAVTDFAGGGWRTIAASTHAPTALLLCVTLTFCVPLLWRRSHPLTVLTVMAVASLVNSWTGAILQYSLLQLLVVYNLALRRPLKQLAPVFVLLAVPLTIGAIRYHQVSWDQQVVPTLWTAAMTALVALAVRTRRDYTDSLKERARQLEVERDQQAQLAAAAERARIAREMHDIIGHNLSVITGLADGGAYAAGKNPQRAVQALDAIGTTSRTALTELRRLLDVLRETPPDVDKHPRAPTLAPQPGLSDLQSLVDRVRAAGLPTRLTVTGDPGTTPAGLQLTVYRIVQEALTNTLKHAGPQATAHVRVSYDNGVTVTTTDTGTTRHPTPEGRGLTGMRERTDLYDGTLESGPLPRGGWRIHLHIPEPTGLPQEDTAP